MPGWGLKMQWGGMTKISGKKEKMWWRKKKKNATVLL